MECFIKRHKPGFGAVDHPVRHCLSGEFKAAAAEILLHPVQRTSHYKLLRHKEGCSFRRAVTAGINHGQMGCLCKLRLADFVFGIFPFAVLAGIVHIAILADHKLGWDDFKSSHNFFPNRLHDGSADRANALLFTQLMGHDFHFAVFRKRVQHKYPFLLFSGLSLRSFPLLLLQFFQMSIDFRLVKEQSHLPDDFFRSGFVLGAKVILCQHLQLLFQPSDAAIKPFVFLLEVGKPFIFRTGNCHCFRGSCCSRCVVFHGLSVPHHAEKRHFCPS